MSASSPSSLVSPEDQSVTFVELFFDLVFVFSVTQAVGFLHHHLDWSGAGQTIVLFWLVWWAWTQFTWALNAADTTHPKIELATLLATAVAFFMAVSVPGAFGDRALWFALPYVLVRVIGLWVYIRVTWLAGPSQHAAVRTFALMSVGGLAAVLAGAIAGGSTQIWLWGLAILLDVIAALVGGESDDWDLRPEHFVERHGLFVIIALGESLIVAGIGLTGAEITPTLLVVGALTVATACALWWSYFACAKPSLDAEMEKVRGRHQARLGRDAFSLFHFPLILGVIGFAAGAEEIVQHPIDPLDLPDRLALGLGVALFTGSMALALWRATGRAHPIRLGMSVVTAFAIVLASGVAPMVTMGIAFVGVAILAGAEHRAHLPGDGARDTGIDL
jgi:low temperature requirement protein LtrA